MPKKVSIIIPSYVPNHKVGLLYDNCVAALREHTPADLYELIIVGQGNGVGAHGADKCHFFGHPIGFAAAVNIGLSIAEGEYVCLLSNDVMVSTGWLETLVEEFESVPNMGALAPMDDDHKPACECNWCVAVRQAGDDAFFRPQVIDGLYRWTIFPEWHWWACVLLKREGFRMDEQFNWRYCDQAASIELAKQGKMIARTSRVVVHHEAEATWKTMEAAKAKIVEAERYAMIEKYGASTYSDWVKIPTDEMTSCWPATPLFSILHSSARPEKWREIYGAWISSAANPEQVEYVLCVDERWGFDATNLDLEDGGYGSGRGCQFKVVWNGGRRCYVDGVNTAAKASTGQILIVNADDQYPCEHWDTRLWEVMWKQYHMNPFTSALEEQNPWPGREHFVISVSTGTPTEHERGIMVMPIVSRARYEQLGYLFYPEYESMFADNDLYEHAKQDGMIIDARHLLFPHKHWMNQARPKDAADREQNRREAFEVGNQVLQRRRREGFDSTKAAAARFDKAYAALTDACEQPKRPTIALCLSGEHFQGEWLDGMFNLYDHLIHQGFDIYRVRGYQTDVRVMREEIRQMVMSIEPKPDYLLWLDDDNILTPEYFDRLKDALDSHEVDGVTAWCWIYDQEMKNFRVSCGQFAPSGLHWIPFSPQDMQGSELKPVEATGFPCFLMKYSALEKAGQYPFRGTIDDSLPMGIIGEDMAFCAAAAKGGAKFLVDPVCRVPHLKYRDTVPDFGSMNLPEPKIAVMMRVRNEARWIERCIKAAQELTPHIYVMEDGSTDDTAQIARDAGAIVLASPFSGGELDESRDKNWLMDFVTGDYSPDWIFCIDGDEELEPGGAQKIRQALRFARHECYGVKFLYLWDKPDRARLDRWYSTFHRLSLFRPDPSIRFVSLYSGRGVHSGLHTGNAPTETGSGRKISTGLLNVYLLHYGYMLQEDRIRKYKYYNRIDPENDIEDRYRHIVQGDVPEVPRDQVLKYAGPLDVRRLPESYLRRPLLELKAKEEEHVNA